MAEIVLPTPLKPVDERCLWLPPKGIRRYQRGKIAVSVLMVAILAGWMVLQWDSELSRWLAGGLLAATVWIVTASTINDLRRARGRQVAIENQKLLVSNPAGQICVPLAQVAYAQWVDQPWDQAGLWFYDASSAPLVHLDDALLADEAEAREFLGWARRLCGLPLPARWPAVP